MEKNENISSITNITFIVCLIFWKRSKREEGDFELVFKILNMWKWGKTKESYWSPGKK